MAELATIATIASIGATVVGTGLSVASSISAGNEAKRTAAILAQQEEEAGREEFAASQREALERRLEGELIMSRQQALAAASGGGAGSDAPTIVKLMSDTAQRSRYGEESVRYGGERRRASLYRSAAARRETGNNSFLGSILSGIGTGVSGIGRLGDQINEAYG